LGGAGVSLNFFIVGQDFGLTFSFFAFFTLRDWLLWFRRIHSTPKELRVQFLNVTRKACHEANNDLRVLL